MLEWGVSKRFHLSPDMIDTHVTSKMETLPKYTFSIPHRCKWNGRFNFNKQSKYYKASVNSEAKYPELPYFIIFFFIEIISYSESVTDKHSLLQ